MASDSDRDHVVRSDMERIFRPTAGRFRARPPEAPAAPRARTRWATLAAPALLLASVGAFAVREGASLLRAERTVAPSPTPTATVAAFRAAAPAATPVPVSPPVPAPVPSAGPDPAPRAKPSPRPKAAEKKATRRAVALADRSRARPRRPAAARRGAAAICPPGSRSDFCIYRDVTSADRRLRAAYAQATHRGVRVKDLSSVRKRWVRARRVSLERPDETIRRYHGLAYELDRMGGGAGRGVRR